MEASKERGILHIYPATLEERVSTGCSGKIVFFHNSLQPLPIAFIAVRDLQSSQRNASVQSLLLAGNFLHNQ